MAADLQTTTPTRSYIPTEPFWLDFHSARLTDEQFEELCRNNRDLKFEMSSQGELIIVPPTSPESGWRNSELNFEMVKWSKQDGTGIVFDSSTLFTLPNSAKRSPDVSWMTKEKWEQVSPSERRKFSRVVPDFVIELLSPTDNLQDTQAKMKEYIANGVRLAWLIDPMGRRVYVYRAGADVEVLDEPVSLSGEDVLPRFELRVDAIW